VWVEIGRPDGRIELGLVAVLDLVVEHEHVLVHEGGTQIGGVDRASHGLDGGHRRQDATFGRGGARMHPRTPRD
jgi:hypothetical protein